VATARTARVTATRPLTDEVQLLDLELTDGGPFGFRGGQYLIVNTGVVLEGGKLAKRAYSLLSSDTGQSRVQIAVKRLDGGPGSAAMHALKTGDELSFSGPWGKLVPEPESPGAALVVCTDTGITAGLGLACAEAFAPFHERSAFLWYVERGDFLPLSFVRERMGQLADRLIVVDALPVRHPERAAHAGDAVRRHLEANGAPAQALLAGDGHLIFPLRDALVAASAPEEGVRLEAFFHNPARKAPG
jgi:ferredoxin-NADP reductase